ncbi:MAG: retropepsin-like aspartic protease family protein [Candidatus Rokuibacteriota bacterium]
MLRAVGRCLRSLLLVALAVVVGPGSAVGQIYHWVDDQGSEHYGMGLESVPQPFRDRARLLRDQSAPAVRGTTPTISFTPGGPILVEVRLNGTGPARLILDTGAERTVISPATLARLRLEAPRLGRVMLQGVTGAVVAEVVRLDSIEVVGVTVGPIPVAIHDARLRIADGLLGQDVLSGFAVSIDATAGVVTLTPRR